MVVQLNWILWMGEFYFKKTCYIEKQDWTVYVQKDRILWEPGDEGNNFNHDIKVKVDWNEIKRNFASIFGQ